MSDITATFTIGLPCGVHAEVRGSEWKVIRLNDGECDSIWCMLNSGEWRQSFKFRWIVEKMIELGWSGPGQGEPCAAHYERALQEWNENANQR